MKKIILFLLLFACHNLMGMDLPFTFEDEDINCFETAFMNNDKNSLRNIIDDLKKYPEKIDKHCFISAIEYNNSEIFEELLEFTEQTYKKYKSPSSEKLITLFLDVIAHMMKIINNYPLEEMPPKPDEKTIYIFLEKFFEIIEQIGHNPFTLTSKNGLTPLIRLLGMYEKNVDMIDSTASLITIFYSTKPNYFLDRVIHYFIEIGVPLYANMNAQRVYGCSILKPGPLVDFADTYPTMQKYFKLIGRYNKQLLNVNDGITTLENLTTFITKLSKEEQEAIFKVAATRGHMKTLAILGKLDDQYKLIEGTKLATKRHLTPIVIKYCNSLVHDSEILENIETTLPKHGQQFFIDCKNKFENKKKIQLNSLKEIFTSKDDDQVKEIIKIMQPIVQNAHSTKFNALINEFRKKE